MTKAQKKKLNQKKNKLIKSMNEQLASGEAYTDEQSADAA